jgi:phage terminase large subunit-like protein
VSASVLKQLSTLSPSAQREFLEAQEPWALQDMARGEWWYVSRPEQQAPAGTWFVWLLLSGRGFGKTRTAAEWLVDRVLKHPVDVQGFRTEWLLIAETMSDALRQCVEGPAGIRRVLERRVGPEKKHPRDPGGVWRLWKSPKAFIQFDTLPPIVGDDGVARANPLSGQVIYIEGADDENVGRGYNAAGAWLDEFAKWRKPDASWQEGIMPSLRADIPGDHPRVVVATTPKLVAQIAEWEDRTDGSVAMTRGSTYDNADNLAPSMLGEFHRRYAGTRLGEQELHGKLIREVQGALWSYEWIARDEVDIVPQLDLRVIGVDPGGTGERDETGLVAAGRSRGEDYILGDWSKKIAGAGAARLAWEMFDTYSGDFMAIESNMGKKWVADTFTQVYREMQKEGIFRPGMVPIKLVHAKVGKELRAQPVATRYEQGGRIHHVRGQNLKALETQMITWVPQEVKDSPDRVDALVYAELEHFARERLTVGATSAAGVLLPRTSLSPLAGS